MSILALTNSPNWLQKYKFVKFMIWISRLK